MDLNVIGQLLIIYCAPIKYLRKNGNSLRQASPNDSVRRKVLYNTSIKLARLTNQCLNYTCSRVQVGKHLSDMLPIRNDLLWNMPLGGFR